MESEAPSSPDHFPMIDAIDHEILMHRDAHFGGLFSVMLEYYRKEGRGVQPEFKISRIEQLDELEKGLKQNLAALYLAGDEAQKVADSLTAYKKLRDIYDMKLEKVTFPRLIADLILTEDEEAESEIKALVDVKDKIVPSLIEILRADDMYDPLFPGYGLTPFLAAKCLEKIGDKRAIISLFEAIGQSDFFADEQILKAFSAIGVPARDFLLKVLHGRPITEDNERAAIGLGAFKGDEEVAEKCFNLLQDADVLKDSCLSTYLALVCEGLKSEEKRKAFKTLSEKSNLSKSLKEDMKSVIREWDEKK